MRPVFESGAPVPAFLNKLWKMVDDERTDNLICWSPGGKSFLIKHQGDFCAQLLPLFYKHSNMASFVRQLNMYGFHKVSNIESGGIRGDREEIEFIHPYFKRGEPKLVEHIKRKMSSRLSNNGTQNDDNRHLDLMNKALEDVAQMKGRQLSLDAQLAAMKQTNVALWRELTILRRKHIKQQHIVNKLIQFLSSMVHSSRGNINGLGVKRRYPLMLYDNNNANRKSKISKQKADSGPIIHELENTDELTEAEAELLEVCVDPVDIRSPASENSTYRIRNCSPILLECQDDSDIDECSLSPDMLFTTKDDRSDLNLQNSLMDSIQSTKNYIQVSKKSTSKDSKSRSLLKNYTHPLIKFVDDTDTTLLDAENLDSQTTPIITLTSELDPEHETEITEIPESDIITRDQIFSDSQDKLLTVENPTLGFTDESSNTVQQNIKSEQDLFTSNSFNEVSTDSTFSSISKDISGPKEADDTIAKKQLQKPGTSKLLDDMSLVSVPTESNVPKLSSAEDLDSHLESMQSELDSLKDLLLFGTDDPLSYSLPLNHNEVSGENIVNSHVDPDPMVSGSELTKYTPGFDFDMFDTPLNIIGTPENSLDGSLDTLTTPTTE